MAIELLFSEPNSAQVLRRTVSTVAEVEVFAGELLARYQSANDMFPGIELRRADGQSLSIAVAPFGWALVHTDSDFDQRCTRSDETVDGGSHDVRWEEPDSVPRSWFVARSDALVAVAQWLTDGSLSPQLTWSDQCL